MSWSIDSKRATMAIAVALALSTPSYAQPMLGAADNTNSRTNAGDLDTWARAHAPGQTYRDDYGRREAMDKNVVVGLMPAEVSRLTGKVDVDHSLLPRTGSDVQAGNMGPTSNRGQ